MHKPTPQVTLSYLSPSGIVILELWGTPTGGPWAAKLDGPMGEIDGQPARGWGTDPNKALAALRSKLWLG